MQIVIDIPNNDIPLKQNVITLDLHFIDGHICECTYPFKELLEGHGRLIDADETRKQYYQWMDELLQSTTINMSAEALSLLCGFTLINNAPTILESEETDEHDIEGD